MVSGRREHRGSLNFDHHTRHTRHCGYRMRTYMRRWVDKGIVHEHFVEWHGDAVQSGKTAFKTAERLARLPGNVTPHTLRHRAATWPMPAGVDTWEAAGFLGMSVEMLDQVYSHHHPDHLRTAAQALSYGRRRQSLAEHWPDTIRAVRSHPNMLKSVVADAVQVEPVSASRIPC